MKIYLLLFFMIPLSACQYHGPKNPPLSLIRDIMRPADSECDE